MSFLEIGGRREAIPDGESVVGSGASADLRLEGDAVAAEHAILRATADGQVVIRRASDDAVVQVNGVRLGPQPTPLLHGDKVGIGPHELLFVDERRSGSTQYVQAVSPAAMADVAAAAKRARPGKPTASTGGRLVSLTDGREYAVAGESLVIGRDAGADVVVTNRDVSRRHAEIMATPRGYVVVDSSTNGTFVNGERIEGQRVLARGDVIKVGDHEFRFYADLAREPEAPPSEAAPGAQERLKNTLMGVPGVRRPTAPTPPQAPRTGEGEALRHDVAPPGQPRERAGAGAPAGAGAGGALAFLVIRSGQLKGQRLPVRTPNVNVGRADYNDLVLPDDSVSTTHAKIQRREGIWMLVDLDSTNGSFVDGERVQGDAPLAPGALVRFGEVRAFFEPADADKDVQQGGSTRMLQAFKLPSDR